MSDGRTTRSLLRAGGEAQATDAAAFARERLGFEPGARQAELLGRELKRVLLNCTRQWGNRR